MNNLPVPQISSLPVPERTEYAVPVRRFNEWLSGRPVDENTVREFLACQARENYSAASLALYRCALKKAVLESFPTHDVRIRAAFDSIFRSIKLPKPDKKVHEKSLLSRDELRALLRALPPVYRVIVKTVYNTGARISEVLSIRFDRCTANKDFVYAVITGKGGKERTLTLTEKLFREAVRTFKGDVFLFESPYRHNGPVPYRRQSVWRMINRAGKAALGRDIHPHCLRHSRITHLLRDEPLDAVSRFAGHAQVSITAGIYGHNRVSGETIRRTGL